MLDRIINHSRLIVLVSMLTSVVFVQLFFNIVFNLAFSRFINVSDLGSWVSSIFLFNCYANLSDLGIEALLFEHNSEEDFQYNILSLRVLLSIIPFFLCVFLKITLGLNSFIIYYSIYFLLERIANYFRNLFDKKNQFYKNSLLEIIALFASYIFALILFFYFKTSIIPVQKISEKVYYLSFVLYSGMIHLKNISFLKVNSLLKNQIQSLGVVSLLNTFSGLFIYDAMPFVLNITHGTIPAGLFAKAYGIATFPLFITLIFNRIMTTKYALSTKIEIKNYFLICQTLKLIILVPVFLLMFCGADYLFPFLGAQWIASIAVFKILLIYSFFRCFYEDLYNFFIICLKKPLVYAQNQVFYASIIILLVGSSSLLSGSLEVITLLFVIASVISTVKIWIWIIVYGLQNL